MTGSNPSRPTGPAFTQRGAASPSTATRPSTSATVTVSAEWSRKPMTLRTRVAKWMHTPASVFVPKVRPSSAIEPRTPIAVHHR